MRTPLLLLAAALLLGCPTKKSEPTEEDRTLAKLKEAQAQGGNLAGPPSREDPNAKLAEVAAKGASDESGARAVPAKNDTVHLGTVALKLVSISTSQIVSGGKMSLSTDQQFLVVRLYAQNVGEREQELDFSMATLEGVEPAVPLARDAQRMAGTKELRVKFGPAAGSERQELAFIFEIPSDAFGKGLKLKLTSPDVDPVSIPLE